MMIVMITARAPAEMHVYRPIDTHTHPGEHAPMLASPLRGA